MGVGACGGYEEVCGGTVWVKGFSVAVLPDGAIDGGEPAMCNVLVP